MESNGSLFGELVGFNKDKLKPTQTVSKYMWKQRYS